MNGKTMLRALACSVAVIVSGAATAQQVVDRDQQPLGPGLIGACCLPNFTCIETNEDDCASQGGIYVGDFSTCATSCLLPIPPNDLCADATPLTVPASEFGTTLGASFDNVPACHEIVGLSTIDGVWYSVIGDGSQMSASLCNSGTGIQGALSVFCACDNLTCVAGAFNNCPAISAGAEVTWCSEPGREYLILVESIGSPGGFLLEVFPGSTCSEPVVPCPDEFCGADHCEDAGEVCPGITYNVDNYTATSDYLEALPNGDINDIFFCGPFFGLFDVWCKYTPAEDGLMFVHIEGPSGVGTEWVFGIYDGCEPVPELGGAPQLLVCNRFVHHGVLTWEVEAGVTYWIRAAARNFDRGEFVLDLVGPDCINGIEESQGPDPCRLDLTGDGVVDTSDIAKMLREATPCADPTDCPSDVTGDGTVDAKDVTTVLSRLGSVCD